jgi:hypothetical protein
MWRTMSQTQGFSGRYASRVKRGLGDRHDPAPASALSELCPDS